MDKEEILLKNERLGDIYCWIVSGSMLIYGYSLAMSAAIIPKQMMNYYQVNLSTNLMISIFNGCFALGGMTGSFFIQKFNGLTSKRRSIFITTVIIILSYATSTIPTIATLFISRFLLGLGCGFSMIAGGTYIRQMFSQRKRVALGGVYSLSKMIGSEITLFISYFLVKNNVSNVHLFISLGGGCLAFIQMILAFYVLPQLPMELMMTYQEEELKTVMSILYREEDIHPRIQQMKEYQKEILIPLDIKDPQTKNRAISAIHCGFLRQFCGIPFIIVFSAQILQVNKFPDLNSTNLLSSSWRLIAGLAGIWIICALNRSRLIIFSTIFGVFCCFMIAIFNAIQQNVLTLAALVAYILPLSSCLEIITWYYPFECTRVVYGRYGAFFSWFGMGCLIIAPPYIIQAMPNRQCYPLFIFFGVYLCFSIWINHNFLVDVQKKKGVDESVQAVNGGETGACFEIKIEEHA